MKTKKVEIKGNFLEFIESEIENIDITENDNLINRSIEFISTGSLSLDISTGVRGIPRGRITEIFGAEAVGKTTLALSISNNATQNNIKTLYIDAESTLDDKYASDLVKNKDLFVVVRPKLMEEVLKIAELGIIYKEFGLIILDSIGSLVPTKVTVDELDDANVALLSRILTTFTQRNQYLIRKNNVAFVGLNQVRDKIGSYGGGYETPGGHAWKHALSLRIMLSRASAKDAAIIKDKEEIGSLIRFVIKKNKLNAPHRSYTFPIIYGKGIDTVRDTLDFAEMLGIVERAGAWYRLDGENLGKGLIETINNIENNKQILDKIVELCYNVVDTNKDTEREELNEQEVSS